MLKQTGLIAIASCLLVLLLVGGCETREGQPAAAAKSSAPPATLRVAVIGDPALAEALRKVRGEWRAESSAELEIWELARREAAGAEKIDADVVIYPVGLLGSLAERRVIRPLKAQWLAGNPLDEADLLISPDSPALTWDGQPYAAPLGEPVFVLAYRADLFSRFGKQPPRTWEEYQTLAEFFGDRDKLLAAAKHDGAKNQQALEFPADWSGTLEPLAADWAAQLLLARAAAYAKHRDYFSVLFDRETMKSLITGPPFVKALSELEEAAKTAHVDLTRLTPWDTVRELLAGNSAMAIGWLSGAQRQNVSEHQVSVAFTELPGSAAAYNLGHQAWEDRGTDEEQRVTLRGISGLAGSVLRGTDHAETAFAFLTWLAGMRWSGEVLPASPSTAMFRQSQLEEPAIWTGNSLDRATAKQYGETVAAALRRRESMWMPRVPGQLEYLAALDQAVVAVIKAKQTPQQALDEAAAQWEKTTDRLGHEKQLEAYRRQHERRAVGCCRRVSMDELPTSTVEPPPKIVRMAILFEGGLGVAAIVCGWFMSVPPWQRLSWQPRDAGWGLAATLPLVLGLLLMRRVHRGPFGTIERGSR